MNTEGKNISLWEDSVKLKHHPRLEGVAGCEVLVIGGGMAGVLTASRLAEEGVDVILAEAGRIGSGTTSGTTGKITSQHGLIYHKLKASFGTENAKMYLDANEEAIKEFSRLCGKRTDCCSFQQCSNYIYSLDNREILEHEMRALEELGVRAAQIKETSELPFKTAGAVEFPMQARFHPLKLLQHLTENTIAPGFLILENTRITKLRQWKDGGWEAYSEFGTILADQVVIASHFPFVDRRGGYFMKMHQSRSLVIAGDVPEDRLLKGMYKDEAEGGLSFREAEGMLLVGGGSGRPGNLDMNWQDLHKNAENCFPGWKTRYYWAVQDCMTLDQIPYIGPYYGKIGESDHGLWVASGFNKWGMTGSMVSAMVLTDQICGRENKYGELFRPNRSAMKPQLFLNSVHSAAGLMTPKIPRCRHLGCALNWNEEEKTWECPCHGSRYDEAGRCIEGPSVKDLF